MEMSGSAPARSGSQLNVKIGEAMLKAKTLVPLFLLIASGSPQAIASPLLDGWAFSIDSQAVSFFSYDPATNADIAQTINLPGGAVAVVSSSLFDGGIIDWSSGAYQTAGGRGLGLITVQITGAANTPHTVTLWLDHSLTQSDFYFTEFGTASGSLPSNTDYGIDDPFYMSGTLLPDVLSGGPLSKALDGSATSGDISLALRLSTFLPTGSSTFSFLAQYSGTDYVSPNFAVPGGFHLQQTSNNGGGTLYFSGSVNDSVAAVPEPGTYLLMGGGCLLLGMRKIRHRRG
jgi:hypothetical protein